MRASDSLLIFEMRFSDCSPEASRLPRIFNDFLSLKFSDFDSQVSGLVRNTESFNLEEVSTGSRPLFRMKRSALLRLIRRSSSFLAENVRESSVVENQTFLYQCEVDDSLSKSHLATVSILRSDTTRSCLSNSSCPVCQEAVDWKQFNHHAQMCVAQSPRLSVVAFVGGFLDMFELRMLFSKNCTHSFLWRLAFAEALVMLLGMAVRFGVRLFLFRQQILTLFEGSCHVVSCSRSARFQFENFWSAWLRLQNGIIVAAAFPNSFFSRR